MISARLQSLRWLLAELLVIILGVLIAFQVDAFNQSRLETRRAQQYVQRLLVNINEDIAELRSTAETAQFRLEAITLVEASLTDDEIPLASPGTYINALSQITWMTPFTSNRATFAELTSTGEIGLLPPALRDSIYTYYGRVADRETIDPAREIRIQARERFAGILTPRQQRLNYQYLADTIPDTEISPGDAQEAAQRLRSQPEAVAWLAMPRGRPGNRISV